METCVFVILIYSVIDCVLDYSVDSVVSNTSKVLKRKQITTGLLPNSQYGGCFQYIKGTKKKANHNWFSQEETLDSVVSNTSKVLKRKQITTYRQALLNLIGCFQYIKGTKKKANHN